MPRLLRNYLLGCVAIAIASLVLHVGEPLRLEIGDTWSDAQIVLGHFYRRIAGLGVDDLTAHRGFALAISVLGAWCLYQYTLQMWDTTTALLATALYTTSRFWLQTADSLERPPLVLSGCFLALWALSRALETGRRRHAAASACGAFMCMLAGSDLRLFLPAMLLFTIRTRRGDMFAWRNLQVIAIIAIGCLGGLVASALLVGDSVPARLDAAPDMVSRFTAMFTPMCWVTVGFASWRLLRATTRRYVFEDAMTWMFTATAIGLAAAGKTGRIVDVLPALPFYAIGSALVITRLLTAGGRSRAIGVVWAVVAPVWALVTALSSPRTVFDLDDIGRARAYLARTDRNDFVISNLLADRMLEVALDRRALQVVARGDDPGDASLSRRWMLGVFESVGTDYVHAVIVRSPATPLLGALDRLTAVGAQRVLRLRNFDVYRVDREGVLAMAGDAVPVVRQLDFGSVASVPHMLIGWQGPTPTTDGDGVSHITGYKACANPIRLVRDEAPAPNACETRRTRAGVTVIDERHVDHAQLMIRVDRACDLRLTFSMPSMPRPLGLLTWLASKPRLGVVINGFTVSQCAPGPRAEFLVPARYVRAGINVFAIAIAPAGPLAPRGEIRTLTIDSVCAPEW